MCQFVFIFFPMKNDKTRYIEVTALLPRFRHDKYEWADEILLQSLTFGPFSCVLSL